MFIRRASNQDLQLIQNYSATVQKEATLGYMNGNHLLINYDMLKYYNGEYHVLVANQQVCGWILLGETQPPYEKELVGMVLELYVLPSWRKHGFGKWLMKYALEFYKNKHFNRVQLNVFAGNHAKTLYEKLGFQDVSTLMERTI